MEKMKFYTYDKILALAKKKTGVSTFLNDDEMFSKLTLEDINSIDTYFKCVNKLSCFAYDEFKDVVLVNYYCNEKNFDNVPESERKKT